MTDSNIYKAQQKLKIDLKELVNKLTTKDGTIYDSYKANGVGTILVMRKGHQDDYVLTAKIFVTNEDIHIQTKTQSGKSLICKWEDPETIRKTNEAILLFSNFQ